MISIHRDGVAALNAGGVAALTPRKSRLIASIAIGAAVVLGTTGCSMISTQATTISYSAAEGVHIHGEGPLAVRNAFIVATADGSEGNFVAAIVNSFQLFPFGRAVPLADAGELAIRTVGGSFALGVQLAAPVLVFSLIFNIAAGLVGRVMPQFQVFVVATPLIVLLGLSIFALSLGVIGMVWIERYREVIGTFAT